MLFSISCKKTDIESETPQSGDSNFGIYTLSFTETNNDKGVAVVVLLQTPDKKVNVETYYFRYADTTSENIRVLCASFTTSIVNKDIPTNKYISMADYIKKHFSSLSTLKGEGKIANDQLKKLLKKENFIIAFKESPEKENLFNSLLSVLIPTVNASSNVGSSTFNFSVEATFYDVMSALAGIAIGAISTSAGMPVAAAAALAAAVKIGIDAATGSNSNGYDLFFCNGPLSPICTILLDGGKIANDLAETFDPINKALDPNYSPNGILPENLEELIDEMINRMKNIGQGNSYIPNSSPGIGSSWGDPHITTFDNFRYNFQAYGEFTALKSTTDNFEIQIRQEEIKKRNDKKLVTFNTGIAINTGFNKISILVNPFKLLVNGNENKLVGKVKLAGGDELQVIEKKVIFSNLNKDLITIIDRGYFLDYKCLPSGTRKGKITGLLGNYDQSSSNDIKTKDGKLINVQNFQELYQTFANSWRITQSESLFTYENGKNTDSYTVKDFPLQFHANSNLSVFQYRAAEKACRSIGVNNEPELSNCILDVASTNDTTLTISALEAEESTRALKSFEINDFGNTSIHHINGDAFISNKNLFLTNASKNQNGSFFLKDRILINNGFEVSFEFSMTDFGGTKDINNQIGGNGLALILHSNNRLANSKIYQTSGSSSIGYNQFPNSVALEFDTYIGNSGDKKLSLNTQGTNPNSSTDNLSKIQSKIFAIPDFRDSKKHKATIKYLKTGDDQFSFNLYFDDSSAPSLTAENINLGNIIGAPDGSIYIGFTAETINAFANHIIHNLSFISF